MILPSALLRSTFPGTQKKPLRQSSQWGLKSGGDQQILVDIVLSVAEVCFVAEVAAGFMPLVTATALSTVTLVEAGEGRADVFEFVVDVEGDFGEAHNHAEDGDGGHQNQFSRDDETSVVVDQFAAERHDFYWGWVHGLQQQGSEFWGLVAGDERDKSSCRAKGVKES